MSDVNKKDKAIKLFKGRRRFVDKEKAVKGFQGQRKKPDIHEKIRNAKTFAEGERIIKEYRKP